VFDFYQKRKLRAIVNSPYTQGFILLLVLLVGWSAYVRYDIAMEMVERREAAELQAAALEAKKQELKERVEYLSGERGIEAEMRRQFDVALEGEQVVVIVDDEPETATVMPLPTTTKETDDAKWYQFWR
jgi:cell division protein FtsB